MKQTFSTLVILGFVFGAVNASAAVEVSGYGDARYSINTDDADATGFVFQEGAVYLKAGDDKAGIMIDLPVFGGSAGNPNFTVGTGKAQGYVHRKYDSGLWWKLGQFDSIYGYEKNDVIHYNYSRRGTVSGVSPDTHAGLAIGTGGFTLLLSDAANTGKQAGGDIDFGLKYATGSLGLGGYRYSNGDILFNVTYGMDMGKMSINLDGLFNLADEGDSGFGALVDVWFEGDGMDWGLRPEFLSKLGGNNSQFGGAIGPRCKVNDNMSLVLNYHFASTKVIAGADSTTSHDIDLAAQYKF